MINRRRFLWTASAAATSVRIARLAARYDLVIQGGRVIDPSRKLDSVRDVAIADGKIAAIQANIPAGGAETLDARGKLVVPGLIDIHSTWRAPREAPSSAWPTA